MLNIFKYTLQYLSKSSIALSKKKALRFSISNVVPCFVDTCLKMSSLSTDDNNHSCNAAANYNQSNLVEPCNITLVACGSFNPITFMHLRMFELAKDYLQGNFPHCTVKSGFVSPVGDSYGKPELADGQHRKEMCQLAVLNSSWIEVKTWELDQEEWSPTAKVLAQYEKSIQKNTSEKSKILYLCGADLLESFSTKGLWLESDIRKIVGYFGVVVITRPSYNVGKIILQSPLLSELKHNIFVVPEHFTNDVSSTTVRAVIRQKQSIKYMVPDLVAEYISKHNLYVALPTSVADELAPFKLYRSQD